jgi:hypothetical protein
VSGDHPVFTSDGLTFLYNTSTGVLSVGHASAGGFSGQEIAVLSNLPSLQATDIQFIFEFI